MLVSIVNRTGSVTDAEIQRVVRAINRQLAEDFEPHWQFGARLRLDAASERPSHAEGQALRKRLPQRQGDAVVYLLDAATIDDAEGYHDRNHGDVPCGFVFLDACRESGDPWSVALSHEVLELVADPMNNLTVQGPHPDDRRHFVFHSFEVCDPVQSESYEIDGVPVSNFVLPGWFTRGDADGVRNDFKGREVPGEVLASFTMAPGGYLCFWDPDRQGDRWHAMFAQVDEASARRRVAARGRKGLARTQRRMHGQARARGGDRGQGD